MNPPDASSATAEWDGKTGLFRQWIGDILHDGTPRPGIEWPTLAVTAARRLHAHQPVPHAYASLARDLAGAIDLTTFDPTVLRGAVDTNKLGPSHPPSSHRTNTNGQGPSPGS